MSEMSLVLSEKFTAEDAASISGRARSTPAGRQAGVSEAAVNRPAIGHPATG